MHTAGHRFRGGHEIMTCHTLSAFMHPCRVSPPLPCLLPIIPYFRILPGLPPCLFAITCHREVAALVRTTVAVTNLHAGVADNVLPNTGSATFNMRSHPGGSLSMRPHPSHVPAMHGHLGVKNTVPHAPSSTKSTDVPREELMAYLQRAIAAGGADASLVMTNASHTGPQGGVSPTQGPYFRLLKQAIQEHWRHGGKVGACMVVRMGTTCACASPQVPSCCMYGTAQ